MRTEGGPVSLGSLALDEPGAFKIGPFGSSLKRLELTKTGIPVIGINNVVEGRFSSTFSRFINREKFEQLSEYETRPGDVLVSTMGTIGKAAVVPPDLGRAIFDSHLFRMRIDSSRTLPDYLCFAVNSPAINRQLRQRARGTIMDGLNTTILKECIIALPDLDEQERIVSILEEAQRLRRVRAGAVESTEQLLEEMFIEFFVGSEYPSVSVAEIVAPQKNAIRTGPFGSQLLHSEFIEDGIAVLGIDNAVNNRFEWGRRRFISDEKFAKLRRYEVHADDVLITIMGTCGRCAVVPHAIPTAINTKHLCCITLDQSQCLPFFLHGAFLFHPSVRRQLQVATKGAIMDGLNMEIIKSLKIPLPPMDVQRKYDTLVSAHSGLLTLARESLRQSELLYETLLEDSFDTGFDSSL